MADTLAVQHETAREPEARSRTGASPRQSSVSFKDLWHIIVRRRRLVGSILGGLLMACLLYCLVAPKQYEASAKIGVRTAPATALNLDAGETYAAASLLSAPVQQETLANVFRSDRLAWKVITDLKLYRNPAFMGRFAEKYPGFRPDASDPEPQAYLLERFARRLHVLALPRTLLIQINFRSKDAVLSADVVNGLIRAYNQQDGEARVQTTKDAAQSLASQLAELQARMESDQQRLANFQRVHGILSTPETLGNGERGEVQHIAALREIDELGGELATVTADRIMREAEYHAASKGNPELVIASNAHLQAEYGDLATALLQQLHARHSELELEQAQLKVEHGQNFPRVVEIRGQLEDLDRQIQAEDARLVERFRSSWQTAQDKEQMVRRNLEERTADGMRLNQAAIQYAVMRQEAEASHELYLRVRAKLDEAGFAAGAHASNIAVVDDARPPAKPVAPDLPLYMAITLFAGIWLAVGAALLAESFSGPTARAIVFTLAAVAWGISAHAQAPTPSTSGLPAGVGHVAPAPEIKNVPNPKEAPPIWNDTGATPVADTSSRPGQPGAAMPAPIGPGDLLDVSEIHTPEFHTAARVSPAGTISLPMVREVEVRGLDERDAARAIESALVAKGMLLHPQVSVMVTAYAGQDVSVLGEVTRPGVYPYTLHHRLLDVISAASGLAPSAGRLVNVFHRDDSKTPHPVVLDPGGTDTTIDHNPELSPGDTVQVSRAGLVYVIGSVVRPGGFPVDPAQGLTVVQALSLAWGPALNANTRKALLISEQKGGRTLTTLNLGRLLHGQDPDQPVHDRDILFVPDSTAKTLWNRTLESAIQSAVGVSIYSGLVYSQRY